MWLQNCPEPSGYSSSSLHLVPPQPPQLRTLVWKLKRSCPRAKHPCDGPAPHPVTLAAWWAATLGAGPRHSAARQLSAPFEDAPCSTDWELASRVEHSEAHHPLHLHQLCRPLPACPLLLPKSQDINPTSPESFMAVCPTTKGDKRPCQDGAVTRLKDTVNVGSWGVKAKWINMLSHRLKLKPCLGCQAKHNLLALTGFTATMDPASLGMVWNLAGQH